MKKKGHDKYCIQIKWLNSLTSLPSGVPNCRNLPFGGRATRGLARSRHQLLFEKNVRKTGKRCGLRTLSVKGSGVIFTHREGISVGSNVQT